MENPNNLLQNIVLFTVLITTRSQHSQECKDPRRHCFCDLWPWPLIFWPQNKWVYRPHRGTLIFVCQVGDHSCINFWDITRNNRQTNADENRPPRLPWTWVTGVRLSTKIVRLLLFVLWSYFNCTSQNAGRWRRTTTALVLPFRGQNGPLRPKLPMRSAVCW